MELDLFNTEVICGVLFIIYLFYSTWRMRIASARPTVRMSPLATFVKTTDQHPISCDVVVVGGGSAGAAAAYTAAQKGLSVLVLERGPEVVGNMTHAMSYAHDLIGSPIDAAPTAVLPLRSLYDGRRVLSEDRRKRVSDGSLEGDLEEEVSAGPEAEVQRYKERQMHYPRGMGIGGTSNLDWGTHYGIPGCDRIFYTTDVDNNNNNTGVVPVNLAVNRSPLSWALHSTLVEKFPCLTAPRLGVAETPEAHSVLSLLLRVSKTTGLRVSPAASLLSAAQQARKGSVYVVADCVVRRIVVEEGRVIGVEVRRTSCSPVTARVVTAEKAVVLCGGIIGTTSLLRTLPPTLLSTSSSLVHDAEASLPFVDTIGIPVLYQSLPGLSDDVANAHSIKAIIQWYLAQKGPVLNVIADTQVLLNVPEHPGAQISILLVPSGGFNRRRFGLLDLTTPLGVFQEGLTFYISLYTLPEKIRDEVAAVGGLASLHPAEEPAEAKDVITDEVLAQLMAASPTVAAELVDCLVHGMDAVREMMTLPPMNQLCIGIEALDTTIFSKKEASMVYKTMYLLPQRMRKGKVKAPALSEESMKYAREIAQQVALSEEYKRAYVIKHARYMGYGTSGARSFMSPREDYKVCEGLYVGDASAAPVQQAITEGIMLHGSVTAAVMRGVAAVNAMT